ncbi:MAG: hypothetical protein NTU61_05820 [Candidatus Altiarchaeota archaeon]|nr:hypothetical protein [Candidatus Altiarchaeota archaeon]
MKESLSNQNKEFESLVGELSQTVQQVSDPIAIGAMLYSIAEEKRSSNLVLRELNAKFDSILQQLQVISQRLNEMEKKNEKTLSNTSISERDQEVLEYVKEKGKVCAEALQQKFNYKGKNAGSARLSKLFKDGLLEKTYVGRKVYYQAR